MVAAWVATLPVNLVFGAYCSVKELDFYGDDSISLRASLRLRLSHTFSAPVVKLI